MNFEQTIDFLGKVNKAFYGVNPYNEICSDLIKKGMSVNEVEAIAREQGIDFDRVYGFDDDFISNKENNG